MSFVLSKLVWGLVQPSNFLLLLLVVGSTSLMLGWRRLGMWLVCSATAVLLAITLLPIGAWLLIPVENRFPVPPLPEQVDGVVVLGGPVEAGLSAAREQTILNNSAERVTALVELARHYPEAKLVVSGGVGRLLPGVGHPADVLRAFYQDQGLDLGRITFEDRSRNTFENAVFTKDLIKPGPDERWLLITSAFHMPRSVGVFRAAGWPVLAYPVDYRTSGRFDDGLSWENLFRPDMGIRLLLLDRGIKSWVGLFAYWLMGRTGALLPAP